MLGRVHNGDMTTTPAPTAEAAARLADMIEDACEGDTIRTSGLELLDLDEDTVVERHGLAAVDPLCKDIVCEVYLNEDGDLSAWIDMEGSPFGTYYDPVSGFGRDIAAWMRP